MEEKQVEQCNDMENTEESKMNSEKIWKNVPENKMFHNVMYQKYN